MPLRIILVVSILSGSTLLPSTGWAESSVPPGVDALPPEIDHAGTSGLWPSLSPCPWGVAERCRGDGHVLIRAGHHAEGIARYGQACQAGMLEACEMWTYLLAARPAGPHDAARAAWAQRALCLWGWPTSCYNAGQAFRRDVDHARAVALFRHGCEALGMHQACAALAFHHANGLGVPRRPDLAAPLFERSCTEGNPEACFNLAKSLADLAPSEAADRRLARAFEDACRLGHRKSCKILDESRDPVAQEKPSAASRDAAIDRLRREASEASSF